MSRKHQPAHNVSRQRQYHAASGPMNIASHGLGGMGTAPGTSTAMVVASTILASTTATTSEQASISQQQQPSPVVLQDSGASLPGLKQTNRSTSSSAAGSHGKPGTTAAESSVKHRKRETLPDIARRIPVDSLRPFLKFSLVSAAKAMGISATTLKRLCRHYGIKRWPYRQISGIDRTVGRLQAELKATTDRGGWSSEVFAPIAAHIHELNRHRDGMVELALEGGHEPVRAKLASVGVFVNTVQGSREARAARTSTPNQKPNSTRNSDKNSRHNSVQNSCGDGNNSISYRQLQQQQPPRQPGMLGSFRDSMVTTDASNSTAAYCGRAIGSDNPCTKAPESAKMPAHAPTQSRISHQGMLPSPGVEGVSADVEQLPGGRCGQPPYQNTPGVQTALEAVAPPASLYHDYLNHQLQTETRTSAKSRTPNPDAARYTPQHTALGGEGLPSSLGGTPDPTFDATTSPATPPSMWSSTTSINSIDGASLSPSRATCVGEESTPARKARIYPASESFPSPGSSTATQHLSPLSAYSSVSTYAAGLEFADGATDAVCKGEITQDGGSCTGTCALQRSLNIMFESSASLGTCSPSSSYTHSPPHKWGVASSLEEEMWVIKDNENANATTTAVDSIRPPSLPLFAGSSPQDAVAHEPSGTSLEDIADDNMTMADFHMLGEMAFGTDSLEGGDGKYFSLGGTSQAIGIMDTMSLPSWPPYLPV